MLGKVNRENGINWSVLCLVCYCCVLQGRLLCRRRREEKLLLNGSFRLPKNGKWKSSKKISNPSFNDFYILWGQHDSEFCVMKAFFPFMLLLWTSVHYCHNDNGTVDIAGLCDELDQSMHSVKKTASLITHWISHFRVVSWWFLSSSYSQHRVIRLFLWVGISLQGGFILAFKNLSIF